MFPDDATNTHAGRAPFWAHPLVVLALVATAGSTALRSSAPPLLAAVTWIAYAAGGCLAASKVRRDAPLPHPRGLGSRAPASVMWWLLLAGAFLFGQARATHARDSFSDSHRRIIEQMGGPRRCHGVAEVKTSPVLRTAGPSFPRPNVGAQTKDAQRKGPEISGDARLSWSGEVRGLDCEGRVFSGPLLVRFSSASSPLARGDHVEFYAQLAPVRLFRNAPLPDPYPRAAQSGALLSGAIGHANILTFGTRLSSSIDRARSHVRSRILRDYAPTTSALARALVLGENDLVAADRSAFAESGLMHLLAVSGTHLVIAVLALVHGMSGLLRRLLWLSARLDVDRAAHALGASLCLLYADFAGGSGSAWRAAFMLFALCGARSVGLRLSGTTALGISLLIGLALDPLAAYDLSFVLSALATAGLIGWGQPLSRVVQRHVPGAPLRLLLQSFGATVVSSLACAPVLCLMSGELTFAALLANVVAAPLGELVALPSCLLHAASFWFPALEAGLALLGSGALFGVRAVALWSASIESARFSVPLPGSYDIATLCMGACVISSTLPLLHRALAGRWRAMGLPLLGASALAVVAGCHLDRANEPYSNDSARGPSPARTEGAAPLRVTALDVGQGDALVIDFPSGAIALVDGGGFATGVPDTGQRVVLPYLRARGIAALDLMVLSHAHPDHLSGLLSVAEAIPAQELWLPGIPGQASPSLRILTDRVTQRGARVRTAHELCSQAHHRFGVRLDVLWPCGNIEPALSLNDASLVVRISHGEHSALFTGDIERRAEGLLLDAARGSLGADLLKVAHHGSDTSSTEAFLRAVAPRVGLVSSGVRNTFGHPRPTTLQRLSQAGVLVLRTDRLGSVTWSTDGQRQSVQAFESPLVALGRGAIVGDGCCRP